MTDEPLSPEMSRDIVAAPWTPTQQRALLLWQQEATVHPLTCITHADLPLKVASQGLFCEACDYIQRWAPRMCVETFPSDHAPPLSELKKQFAPDPEPESDPPPPEVAQAVEGIEALVVKQAGERVAALTIALRLMEMHLELATPGGAGRDSIAWSVAQGRLKVLRDLRAEIASLLPPTPPDT